MFEKPPSHPPPGSGGVQLGLSKNMHITSNLLVAVGEGAEKGVGEEAGRLVVRQRQAVRPARPEGFHRKEL